MATAVTPAAISRACRTWPNAESFAASLRRAHHVITDTRYAAEDLAAGTILEVRRHPLRSLAMTAAGALSVGALVGFTFGWTRTHA